MGTDPFRADAIRAYLRAHPQEPFAAVARHFGVTRQWVQQIAAPLGISKRRLPPQRRVRICPDCGERAPLAARSGAREVQRRCPACAGVARRHRVEVRCDRCGRSYLLVGSVAAQYRYRHRIAPSRQSWCPSCVGAGRRSVTPPGESWSRGQAGDPGLRRRDHDAEMLGAGGEARG